MKKKPKELLIKDEEFGSKLNVLLAIYYNMVKLLKTVGRSTRTIRKE